VLTLSPAGLDSQTAWSICALLRKLANHGQAILCTIHQPSAELFQTFDRLIFLAMEGKTVYFGDIGESSRTVVSYFESKGARRCESHENPAEWILEVTGTPPADSDPDFEKSNLWAEIWNESDERKAVKMELARLRQTLSQSPVSLVDPDASRPYAVSLYMQLRWVLRRNFQQYWRTPSYLYPKVALCLGSVSFHATRPTSMALELL
jgi:ATP-binding cassette, subfamily G (WHITE), member 2, PDR